MNTSDFKKIKVQYEQAGAIVRLTLNAPKANVLDAKMMQEITEAVIMLSTDKNLKALLIEGEGKHFSFGASVSEHTKEKAGDMLNTFHEMFHRLRDLSVPVISLISGQCLGGGFELALFAHFMFADRSASMGVPEIKLGVFPPPASIFLPLKIGTGYANSLLLTGESITADRAYEMGLLQAVFADNEAMQSGVNDFIEKEILPKSASSLKIATAASRMFFNHIMDVFLNQLQQFYINGLMETHDANEGIQAFLENRPPEWKNE